MIMSVTFKVDMLGVHPDSNLLIVYCNTTISLRVESYRLLEDVNRFQLFRAVHREYCTNYCLNCVLFKPWEPSKSLLRWECVMFDLFCILSTYNLVCYTYTVHLRPQTRGLMFIWNTPYGLWSKGVVAECKNRNHPLTRKLYTSIFSAVFIIKCNLHFLPMDNAALIYS